MNKELYEKCITVATKAINDKGHSLNPEAQVQNIFNYAATDKKFADVTNSNLQAPAAAELLEQIKYICEIGVDTAKGKKLVYVKTRGLNIGTKERPKWITMPDIQESYHALIHILVRSGLLKHITVLHTYQNYPIEYSGLVSDVPIVKSWEVMPNQRGEYTGCFVIITYPSGEVNTSYHHLSDILSTHETYSKSGNTWKSHRLAMVAKSAILDATRYIPVFDEVVSSIVEHYDSGMEYNDNITEEQAMRLESMLDDVGADKARFLKTLGAMTFDSIPSEKYKMAFSTVQRMQK